MDKYSIFPYLPYLEPETNMSIVATNITNNLTGDSIHKVLQSKKYFGFDLDDTLHEFRKASSYASAAVCDAVHQETRVNPDALKATYTKILQSRTASAFVDGRMSVDYRRDRFSHLLQAYGIEASNAMLDRLLDTYQSHLSAALVLKTGALSLLQTLKGLDKKIVIITEGPQDAQEWTVRQLGIAPYIDILVTTNEIGKPKVNGLFSAVLEKYGIHSGDMVYVGDNEVRDVRPTKNEGLLAILYDERRETGLDDPETLCISSLSNLEHTVRS